MSSSGNGGSFSERHYGRSIVRAAITPRFERRGRRMRPRLDQREASCAARAFHRKTILVILTLPARVGPRILPMDAAFQPSSRAGVARAGVQPFRVVSRIPRRKKVPDLSGIVPSKDTGHSKPLPTAFAGVVISDRDLRAHLSKMTHR